MAIANWNTSDDIGLSKKHDAPPPRQFTGTSTAPWNGLRRRRFVLVCISLIALFIFFKNIPTDIVPVSQRHDPRFSQITPDQIQEKYGHTKANTADQQYEGPLEFSELLATLRPHYSRDNGNDKVLFALPEVRAISNLVPLACQMAQSNRSRVHIALLGRSEISVQQILNLNGIPAKNCPVTWHDARPNRALESSESRNGNSIQAGLAHCCLALRPQIVLADEHSRNDDKIDNILHEVTQGTGTFLVTVPTDSLQSVSWISTLDSSSLRALPGIALEIIVKAYPDSAGSLIRLLRSIEAADYRGIFRPYLTLELPAKVDPILLEFLENFHWPPGSAASDSKLILRRRLRTNQLQENEASTRTIESFYPRAPSTNHVLLLSPDTELSPKYLKYLLFTLLEYRYGRDHQGLSESLFGISLELPSTSLGGSGAFFKPTTNNQSPFVLSQTPNGNAVLIPGDKWVELHTFLDHRLAHDAELSQKSANAPSITTEYSQWLQEALDLMRTRGYVMHYPAFAARDDQKLVTIHKELHQPPEEYTRLKSKESKAFRVDDILGKEILTGDVNLPIGEESLPSADASLPLQLLLSSKDKNHPTLPKLIDLPLYTFEGKKTSWSDMTMATASFADEFSLNQGGCRSLEDRKRIKDNTIDSLFCSVG